jgi:hypothetical protein
LRYVTSFMYPKAEKGASHHLNRWISLRFLSQDRLVGK